MGAIVPRARIEGLKQASDLRPEGGNMIRPINRLAKSNPQPFLACKESLSSCWENSIYSLATWPISSSWEGVHPRQAIMHGVVLLCLQWGSSSSCY